MGTRDRLRRAISRLPAATVRRATAREKHPNVPVGIIQISWGGTGIALHMKGGSIYANHVIPLTGYRVAGVLWYQGEDDTATQATALRYEK